MTSEELNEARINPDFLKFLEENRLNAIKEKNLEQMYETLDSMLVLDLDVEKLNSLYEEIVKVAFENLENKLEKNESLYLENSDFLTIRALYEFAIEKWSNLDFELSKALFFTLINIINDEFLKKNMEVLFVYLTKKLDFEDFYEEFVDKDELEEKEEYGYFITSFKFNVDDFLNENNDLLKKEYQNLEHLIEKKEKN